MKTLSLRFWKHPLALSALLALAAPALPAQTAPLSAPTAPPPSNALASIQEDIQGLQREVGQLNLRADALEQENADLKKKILSQDELKATVANMIAASRAEINKDVDRRLAQATDDSRKDILAEVAKEMKSLADETNVQLEKLAHAIGNAPAPHPVTVTAGPPPAYTGKGIDYVVKHGETLAIICRNNHVTSKDVLQLNPQLNGNPNHIVEGQHLFLPQKDGASTSAPSAGTDAPASTGAVLNFPKQ